MTFLSRLGGILLQTGAVIAGLKPLFPLIKGGDAIEKFVDKLTNPFKEIIEVIVMMEAIGQALKIPGPDKLKAAAPIVGNIVLKSDMLIGKKIKNQALFTLSVEQITNGVVGVLNSVDAEEVKEEKITKP